MRTLAVVWLVLLGLALTGTGNAQTSPRPLTIHRVAGNVYMLESEGIKPSFGSNIAALVGADGVLLVDAHGTADALSAMTALRTLSDKPVRYVIDTHCHGDHTGGNAGFQAKGAIIVAHENVRKRMLVGKCDQQTALPTLTFDSELTLQFDGEEVRIIKLPKGHTDGDSLVYFVKAHVAATGDAFVSKGLPSYSRYAGGNMLGVNEQLHRVLALLPADIRIIPGHGPEAKMNDVRRASEALDGIRDAVAAQIRKGKPANQLLETDLFDPWKDLVEVPERLQYIRSFYDCLSNPPDSRFQL